MMHSLYVTNNKTQGQSVRIDRFYLINPDIKHSQVYVARAQTSVEHPI